MDKDMELSKIRIAANAVESDAQRELSLANTFFVSYTIFVLAVLFQYRLTMESFVLLYGIGIAIVFLVERVAKRRYDRDLSRLEGYFENVKNGTANPRLKTMCLGEKKIRFYHRSLGRLGMSMMNET